MAWSYKAETRSSWGAMPTCQTSTRQMSTRQKSHKLIGVLPLYRAIPLYRAWSFDESLCVYCGALQWLYGIENIALDRASKRHKLGWLLDHEGFTCDVIVAIMAKSPVRYLAVSLGIKAYRYISRWLLRWSSFLVELERVWEFWASSCTGFFKLRFLQSSWKSLSVSCFFKLRASPVHSVKPVEPVKKPADFSKVQVLGLFTVSFFKPRAFGLEPKPVPPQLLGLYPTRGASVTHWHLLVQTDGTPDIALIVMRMDRIIDDCHLFCKKRNIWTRN